MKYDNLNISFTARGSTTPFYTSVWRRPVMTETEFNDFVTEYNEHRFDSNPFQTIAEGDNTNPDLNDLGSWLWGRLSLINATGWLSIKTPISGTSEQDWYSRYFPGFSGDAYATFSAYVAADPSIPQNPPYIYGTVNISTFNNSKNVPVSYFDPNATGSGYSVGPTFKTTYTALTGSFCHIPNVTPNLGSHTTDLTLPLLVTDSAGVVIKYGSIQIQSVYSGGFCTYRANIPTTVTDISDISTGTDADIASVLLGTYPVNASDDPYGFGGFSGTGGGTGTFEDSGTAIGVPGFPSISAASSNFIQLYRPTITEIRSLASYLWTGAFDPASFRKLFADPMDAILGLSIVPVNVPTGGTQEVKVGNIGTGINMTIASNQYVDLSCGTINLREFWGSYLDYDPYTKIEIYLPYIGTHQLSADDVMGKPITLSYHVDIMSGACVALISINNSVQYSYIGQCSASIPITSTDWTSVINGTLSIAGSIGTIIATGGLSAPVNAAAGAIASTAINSMKPNIEKSGSVSGIGGMLGVQQPYLIITRPRQAVPENQNYYSGYPSYITKRLSDVKGYTEIDSCHLEDIPATGAELDEIDNLLKGGVIL